MGKTVLLRQALWQWMQMVEIDPATPLAIDLWQQALHDSTDNPFGN